MDISDEAIARRKEIQKAYRQKEKYKSYQKKYYLRNRNKETLKC